jgi:hypothetical protein
MTSIGPAIQAVAALVTLGAMVFAVVVTVITLMMIRRKATGSTAGWASQVFDAIAAGNIPAAERAVLANGWTAEATILHRNDIKTTAKNRTMIYYLIDFVLEVRPPDRAAYRVQSRQEFIRSEAFRLTQGEPVPVRVDPNNPQVVYIDREARKQRALAAEAAERDAGARRQAELLGRR